MQVILVYCLCVTVRKSLLLLSAVSCLTLELPVDLACTNLFVLNAAMSSVWEHTIQIYVLWLAETHIQMC